MSLQQSEGKWPGGGVTLGSEPFKGADLGFRN